MAHFTGMHQGAVEAGDAPFQGREDNKSSDAAVARGAGAWARREQAFNDHAAADGGSRLQKIDGHLENPGRFFAF